MVVYECAHNGQDGGYMGHEMIALWTETSSDPELIAGVRAGDSAAFGVLYERHAVAARKVAAQYTNTPTDIDDVVSESFSRVLRALQQGDGPDLAFRAYLFTIVRRTGMDLINKGIRTKPRDDMSPYESSLGYEASSDEPAMADSSTASWPTPSSRCPNGGKRCCGTPRSRRRAPKRSLRCWACPPTEWRRCRTARARRCARRTSSSTLRPPTT